MRYAVLAMLAACGETETTTTAVATAAEVAALQDQIDALTAMIEADGAATVVGEINCLDDRWSEENGYDYTQPDWLPIAVDVDPLRVSVFRADLPVDWLDRGLGRESGFDHSPHTPASFDIDGRTVLVQCGDAGARSYRAYLR
jgi:hypothetical protein